MYLRWFATVSLHAFNVNTSILMVTWSVAGMQAVSVSMSRSRDRILQRLGLVTKDVETKSVQNAFLAQAVGCNPLVALALTLTR
jgi:hypothetical protein